MQIPNRARIVLADDNTQALHPLLRPFIASGIALLEYKNFGAAWNHRKEIGDSGLLVVNSLLPYNTRELLNAVGFRERSFHQVFAGLELVKLLRKEGYIVPILVTSKDDSELIPGGREGLISLYASFLRMDVNTPVNWEGAILQAAGWYPKKTIERH